MKNLSLFLILILFILGFANFIAELKPIPNDDAYVYYNYAKNFIEGRPFAYDRRNIPSEGFSSLVYLLLLVPFEFFHVNMSFASAVLNIIALLLSIFACCFLIYKSAALNRNSLLLFVALFSVFLLNDSNTKDMIAWGLETMWGALVYVLASLALFYASSKDSEKQPLAITAFFVISFIAYVTRPESMPILVACAVPILFFYSDRRALLQSLVVFVLLLLAYHAIKYFIFGDIFPTGFYRKVGGTGGIFYVLAWMYSYKYWFLLLFGFIALSLLQMRAKGDWSLLKQPWLWFLAGISVLTLLFFTRTQPLIGNGFRFLVSPLLILIALVVFLGIWLLEKFLDKYSAKERYQTSINVLLLVGLNIFLVWQIFGRANLNWQSFNIYAYSVEQTQSHEYLQLGYFLRSRLSHPEDITFVFGDAGAIPYALNAYFIDTNGLTEPAIAHLFQMADGEEKTRIYINHILSYHPDIIVLAYGDATNDWEVPINQHSPFREAIPIEVWAAYQEYGIVYECSLSGFYGGLHLGIWQDSPYYEELRQSLDDYCSENGFFLENGLTVIGDGQEVHFDRPQ